MNSIGNIKPFLQKVIRSGVGRWRFFAATLGLLVALVIILLSLQLYLNFNQLLHGKANESETAEFLVISKEVTAENQSKKNESYFLPEEIALLGKQPFADRVGEISSTNFIVTISSFSNAFPFYTDAYFESVPDEFIDIKTEDWSWKQGQVNIPVIIPSFFLELYNTGMAMSQENLPRLSLEALQAIPLRVNIKHSGGTAEFVAHVAGTTDRLNSVLVPEAFMQYANKAYGYQESKPPTRLVLKTLDAADPALQSFLVANSYTTNSDKTKLNKARIIVNWIAGVVGIIGLIMLLFGMLVFTLFIQLTIAASRMDIVLLQTLGASPRQLSGYLMGMFMPVYGAMVMIALLVLSVLQYGIHQLLLQKQLLVSPWLSVYTLAAAALWLLLIWFVNKRTITNYLKAG